MLYERARRLMTSPKLKSFKLDDEPAARQQAYGKNPFGQGLLVARRLVEAGVPFVEVRRGGWDMHNSLFSLGSSRPPPRSTAVWPRCWVT